jgi:cold-inducible RNA-binding protein
VKNIFVGNLDFNVTEDAVRKLFESHGAVNSARIMTDRDTGRSRGFAFVEMENEPEADQAIAALNGYTLEGRALNVNEARPKPDRGFGGGGGRWRPSRRRRTSGWRRRWRKSSPRRTPRASLVNRREATAL